MRISLNEIKKLVPAASDIATDELVKLIGSRLVEVEGTIDLSKKYENIFVVKVESVEPIEGTHLHLCQIDAGKNEKVQVVCGAPNVQAGMHAVWIAPGAIVPQTFGGENFQLDVRKLRGFESHGMLAGLDELDLGDDHSGIVEIDPQVSAGTPFAEAFDLNDVILDIENKSLTHRPDCFGLIGFAREVAGILGVKFEGNSESVVSEDGDVPSSPVVSLDPALCARYSCAVIKMSDALSDDKYLTPMDVFLAKAGMRGISKIVDVTNYLMLMTGQPLHAFDYDKFVKVVKSDEPKIIVRAAKPEEKLELLDGKTISCVADDILITSNDVPVALAGAMGGKSTEIDEHTTTILLESATFSLYHLRKTQMAHGIFSEAITRFTKGQPASQTMSVLGTACQMLGGEVVAISDAYPREITQPIITVTAQEINSLLGTKYSEDLIIKTLDDVGFSVKKVADALDFTAPEWRTDIHIKEDIIEEVGRLLGFDNIPLDLPLRPFIGATENPLLALKTRLRDLLSGRFAAHEVLTYSFVSKKLQEQVGEDPEDSYRIVNSISPELQCFRQTLVPSLIEKTRDNLKAGFKDFSLFEINQVTKKSYGNDADGVPNMKTHLAFATLGDYYQAKAALSALLAELGLDKLQFTAFAAKSDFPYLESLHSASVTDLALSLGEVKPKILKSFKIAVPVSVFELDLDELQKALPATQTKNLRISKFPSVERDLTVKVTEDTPFDKVYAEIMSVLEAQNLIFTLSPTSIYQPEVEDASGQKSPATTKNLSFHLQFSSPDKTLENSEISAIMEQVNQQIKGSVGAEIV